MHYHQTFDDVFTMAPRDVTRTAEDSPTYLAGVGYPFEDSGMQTGSRSNTSSDGRDTRLRGVEIFAPRLKATVCVPRGSLLHLPFSRADPTRPPKVIVLCNDFDSFGECPRGTDCWYAHAVVDGLPVVGTHINFAWRTVQDVVYPRMQSGKRLHVAAPNSRRSVEIIPSDMVLQTQALNAPHRLTHCAHFYFNRACRLGAQCGFVHAICIDPDAKDHHIAPGPTGDAARAAKKQRSAQREVATATALEPALPAPRTAPPPPTSTPSATTATLGESESTVPTRPRQHNPYAVVPSYIPAL